MKMKHSVIAALIALLLIAVVAVTGIADSTEYTGNVSDAQTLLARFENANNTDNRRKALDAARVYFETVNPEEEGYSALAETLGEYSYAMASEYLELATNANTTAYKLEMLDLFVDSLATHPVSEAHNGYAALMSGYEAAAAATAEGFLAEAIASDSANEKHAKLDGVKAIIDNHAPKTLADDFDARHEAECFATAELLLENLDAAKGTAKNGVAVRTLLNFTADHKFSSEVDGFAEYAEELELRLAEHNAAIEAAKLALTRLNTPSQFTADIEFNIDFDNVSYGLEGDNNLVNGEIVSEIGVESGMDGDNKYHTVNFDYANRHLRTTAKLVGVKYSYVYEMDLTTFDHLPNGNINIEDYITENGTTWNPVHFTITAAGNFIKGSDVILANAIIPGQWTHVSVAINVNTANIDIYVDYELVYSYSLAEPKKGYTSFTPSMVRIGGSAATAGGSLSIDNFMLYSATAPIDFTNFNSWTDEQKFNFYASRLTDNTASPYQLKEYYNELTNLLHVVWDGSNYLSELPETRAAVDAYLASDVTAIDDAIKVANLSALEELYNKLYSYTPGESDYLMRTYYLAKLDALTSSTVGAILSNDRYLQIIEYIGQVREELAMEELSVEFITYVNNFYAAPTVDKKRENCNLALELLPKLDLKLLNNAQNYPKFVDAYIRSQDMEQILLENVCIDNSKLLLACITFVLEYGPEDEWDKNYTILAPYVATARRVIEEGNYDVYYNNLGKAIENFAPMNEYFFNRMLEERHDYVASEIERLLTSDVYFEKYGICMKLKEYFVENDIDTSEGDFAEYLATVNNVLAELVENEEAYEAMLAENTEKFIKVCEGLVGSIDYKKMKEICAEAAVYYYNMNVSNALAQDAIKIYTTRRNEVKAAEETAEAFIASALRLTVFEDGNILPLFIETSEYLDDIDLTVPGVTEALEIYESKMAEFDSTVETLNAEIRSATSTVVYVSNTPGVSTLITKILQAIFN